MDESIYLGDIDVSNITNMSWLFFNSERTDFSGIEKWNVSNVRDMYGMFCGCKITKEQAFSGELKDKNKPRKQR